MKNARKPRRQAVEPFGRDRVKLTICLDAETARRLRTFAAWHGREVSAIVAEQVAPLLDGFVVSLRSGQSQRSPDGQLIGPPQLLAGSARLAI